MKAIFLLSLVGSAFAGVGFLPLSAVYATASNGVCTLKPGYGFYATTGVPTTVPITANAVAAGSTWALEPLGETLTATTCQFWQSDSTTLNANSFVFYCLPNYTANGIGSNTQIWGGNAGNGNTWETTTAAVAGIAGPADFSLASPALTCVPVACNYTCTTVGTGSGCKVTSGAATPGALPQGLCNTGYYASVTSPAAATTSCPTGGLNGTTWVVTCSNVISSTMTTAQWFLVATAYPGWSEPKSCNCATDPVCPSKNSNSPTCSKCNLSPCVQTNAGPFGTLGAVRANTFAAAAFCPAGTTTIAAMWDCFEQAACGGAIAKGDLCIFGVANQAGTAACPTCPSGSKKGLLGLLGLLGLIPLLLCSSLLCLLLFCIRRNKKERDVHFATFDAGAPAVVAPVCHDFPVAHQTQTVHHATYVGPQHCAVPSGFGY